MKIAITLLSLLAGTMAFSQDSLKQVKVISPSLYLDYGKGLAAFSHQETKWEGGFELLFFDKWQTIVEVGYGQLKPEAALQNGDYMTEGNYYRLGAGFMPEVDKGSRLGIGFRYAVARFEDEVSYSFESPSALQDPLTESTIRNNLSANWFEAVFYTDRSLNSWLDMGLTFRMRFMNTRDRTNDVVGIYTIPGYGRAEDKSIPAFNLFVKISPF